MSKYKLHLFICTNFKKNGESCGPKGAESLRNELKKRTAERFPLQKSQFRVNSSGCLGFCEQGIASVCYPEGDWKLGLQSDDLPDLENWLADKLNGLK